MTVKMSALLTLIITILLGSIPALGQERAIVEEKLATNRIALLIGNSEYKNDKAEGGYSGLKALTNPCNDIDRIWGVLEKFGWKLDVDLIVVCDGDRKAIVSAVETFKNAYLSNPQTFGFIFYSGHGIQIGEETYLFGTDAYVNWDHAADLAISNPGGSIFPGGVRLFHDVISQVGDAGSGSIFIVIDACRETPIDDILKAKMAGKPGMLPSNYPKPVPGIKLLYSTAYGQLASDGLAAGSPFAIAFEKHLEEFGEVDLLVSHVVKTVTDATKYSSLKQMPDTTGALNPPPPQACLTKCGD